ncbi:MAG: preprotein translocase subunit YajC [Clostridiaceae bacterium]
MSSQLISTVVYMVFFLGVFYVVFYFPDKKNKMKQKNILRSLTEGENIITTSGIVGKVISISENHIIIETGPDKIKIEMIKSCISKILK